MTTAANQIAAINKALALYDEKIERIETNIGFDIEAAKAKKPNGAFTAEALRAQERIKHGRELRDSLIADRANLAEAFVGTICSSVLNSENGSQQR